MLNQATSVVRTKSAKTGTSHRLFPRLVEKWNSGSGNLKMGSTSDTGCSYKSLMSALLFRKGISVWEWSAEIPNRPGNQVDVASFLGLLNNGEAKYEMWGLLILQRFDKTILAYLMFHILFQLQKALNKNESNLNFFTHICIYPQ